MPEMSEDIKNEKGTNSTTTVEMSYSIKGKIGNIFLKKYYFLLSKDYNRMKMLSLSGKTIQHTTEL